MVNKSLLEVGKSHQKQSTLLYLSRVYISHDDVDRKHTSQMVGKGLFVSVKLISVSGFLTIFLFQEIPK